MKLSDALIKITPLPLELHNAGRGLYFIGTPDAQTQVCDLRDGMKATAEYMVHASNTLPDLARWVRASLEDGISENERRARMVNVRVALARAEKV